MPLCSWGCALGFAILWDMGDQWEPHWSPCSGVSGVALSNVVFLCNSPCGMSPPLQLPLSLLYLPLH